MQVVWFKRDLRVDDHRPLRAACAAGPVLPLYVVEPGLWAQPHQDASRLGFVAESLAEADRALRDRGSALVVRTGEVVDVLAALHDAHGIDAIHAHEETGDAWTFARDRAVTRWCRTHGVALREIPQHGVFRPHPQRDGWAARWEARFVGRPRPAPDIVPWPEGVPRPPRLHLPDASVLGLPPTSIVDRQPGGSAHAHALLVSFLDHRGGAYRRAMSSPVSGWDGCSRLSAHLAHGTISLRAVHHAVLDRLADVRRDRHADPQWAASLEAFGSRLRWNGHFQQKLEDEPALEFRNVHRAYDGLRTEDPARWTDTEQARFEAWRDGRTGLPMVDAVMRSLAATGWTTFRMRAMVMSAATHLLWLHWREPAVVLARRFLDFEPGIHFAQAQMQAGTMGINTTRVYNPVKQAHDHDPDGAFLARWVPELAAVPPPLRAAPWRMTPLEQAMAGVRLGVDYPAPIVDPARAAREATDRLHAVKGSDAGRAGAAAVFARHGSRKGPRRR